MQAESARIAEIAANLAALRTALPERATLIAVSKLKPLSDLLAAAQFNQRDFGENYVQEALEKMRALHATGSSAKICWHLIGPLQSNKCREVAEHFDWLHSLDRSKLIAPLARYRSQQQAPLNVLIQVNIDNEQSKAGCHPDALQALAQELMSLSTLRLRGLMVIPNPTGDLAQSFSATRALFDALRRWLQTHYPAQAVYCDTLSMGMSDDYALALEHGATMVRIGSKIFGARALKA
jgi:PLP dependent protein